MPCLCSKCICQHEEQSGSCELLLSSGRICVNRKGHTEGEDISISLNTLFLLRQENTGKQRVPHIAGKWTFMSMFFHISTFSSTALSYRALYNIFASAGVWWRAASLVLMLMKFGTHLVPHCCTCATERFLTECDCFKGAKTKIMHLIFLGI